MGVGSSAVTQDTREVETLLKSDVRLSKEVEKLKGFLSVEWRPGTVFLPQSQPARRVLARPVKRPYPPGFFGIY